MIGSKKKVGIFQKAVKPTHHTKKMPFKKSCTYCFLGQCKIHKYVFCKELMIDSISQHITNNAYFEYHDNVLPIPTGYKIMERENRV